MTECLLPNSRLFLMLGQTLLEDGIIRLVTFDPKEEAIAIERWGVIAFPTPTNAIAFWLPASVNVRLPTAPAKRIASPPSVSLHSCCHRVTGHELIPPHSMSSGKSSADIPALCISSINRLIWGSENLISLSPVSWRLIVRLVVPSSVANSSCVIPSRSRNCLRAANSGLLFEFVSFTILSIIGHLFRLRTIKMMGKRYGKSLHFLFPCLSMGSFSHQASPPRV